MQLLHSPETEIKLSDVEVDNDKLLAEHDGMLAGAVLCDVSDDEDYVVEAYWRAFSVHEYASVVSGSDPYVLGAYEADIEDQIKTHYFGKSGTEGLSCIERVEGRRVNKETKTGYHRGYRGRHSLSREEVTGWIVHDRVFTEATQVDVLRQICDQVGGPILIPTSTFNALDEEEGLSDYGFTCRWRKSGCYQINYNPAAIERRPYLAARREVEKRLKGEWPSWLLHNLASDLHPSSWPRFHPFKDIVSGPDLYRTRGWGHQSNCAFSPEEILQLKDLTLKLWPGQYWWREKESTTSYSHTFGNHLIDALLHVHGVEMKYAEVVAGNVAEAKKEYAYRIEEKWDVGETGRPLDANDNTRELTEQEFVDSYVEAHTGHWDTKIKFARWLRSEARAMKIKMPKKPVYPLSPAAQRRKAAKKRKRKKKKRV